jgi:hypothetical protein
MEALVSILEGGRGGQMSRCRLNLIEYNAIELKFWVWDDKRRQAIATCLLDLAGASLFTIKSEMCLTTHVLNYM